MGGAAVECMCVTHRRVCLRRDLCIAPADLSRGRPLLATAPTSDLPVRYDAKSPALSRGVPWNDEVCS
jgi:hypothetical protein